MFLFSQMPEKCRIADREEDMDFLKNMIVTKGRVIGKEILKVDEFLNHQLNVELLNEMGKEFYRYFKDKNITKILTIEASGIAIAVIAAQYFGCDVVFAKKTKSLNLHGDMYKTKVHSFTKKEDYEVLVAKKLIDPQDRLLIIDDFLAEGSACLGLLDIVEQSGATLSGVGIAIEKGFQVGGRMIREKNVDLYSLAIVESMDETTGVVFA